MSGAPANSGQQVLIVEDNEALAENLAELLEPLHVNTRIAGTAGECERALQEVEPAVAIVDVSLPDASGLDVLRTLKTAVKDVEVVFVTGHGSLATAMDAIALGAFGYLLKPVDPEGFAQLVERALSAVSLRAERKQLARALSASETLHRTVVDSVDACVLGLRDSGAIVMANRTGRRLFGDALEGTPFSSLFEGDETIDEKLARCASGEATEGWVTQHGERLIRWSLTRVDEEPGSPDQVAVGTDITEQEALRKSAAEKEALAAVGVLTAGLAHEIRNPLNAAQLQLQLLARRSESDDVKGRVAVVRDELGRLSSLLDEFLGLARQGSRAEAHLRANDLFDAVIALEAPLCDEHGIQVASEPNDVAFFGESAGLHQALINLVKNAREALQEGGNILLRAATDGDHVVLSVLDDGPGPDTGSAFEPFHTTKAAGTGLGLSVVRKVAEAHGGGASLEAGHEGGAVATIRFPLRKG